MTAYYLTNRTPTAVLNWKTRYEILFNDKPSYDQLCIFDTLCYAYNIQKPKDKFGTRSTRCVFIEFFSNPDAQLEIFNKPPSKYSSTYFVSSFLEKNMAKTFNLVYECNIIYNFKFGIF